MTSRLLYTLSLCLIISLLSSALSQAQHTQPIGPRITIEPQSIDFGIVEGAEAITRSAIVRNSGDAPLEAQHECSCGMLANPWRSTILPGEIADLPFTINPQRFQPGPFKRSMTIRSNDPSTPVLVVSGTGVHRPLAYLAPPVIQFGTVPAGCEGNAILTISSRDKDFGITSIETGHPLITARHLDRNPVVAPDPDYPGRQEWEFTLSKDAPTGSLSSTAKIVLLVRHPDRPDGPSQEIVLNSSIIAHVLGHLSANPRFIRVAQAFPGESFSETTRITSDRGPFKITGCNIIESTLPGVTARIDPVPGSDAFDLIFQGKGNGALGMFRGYLELTTDIPNESPLRIQFNGFIREMPAAP